MAALALDWIQFVALLGRSKFNLVFKKHTNQTPSDYQRVANG